MEKIIVAVEGSHNGNEPSASASKCLGSVVQINSIAIDINCAMEMEEIVATKHEHFSIRGFVSEMRKKDRKMCLPFPPEVNGGDIDIDPPPLSVPKFRWWQCSECVQGISDRSTLEMVLADKIDVAGTSSNQNANRGEKYGFPVQSIDDMDGSRDSNNGDYNYRSDKLIEFNPRCTEEHKAVMNVRSNEVGTSRIHITESSSVHISEIHKDNADPSTRADEPEHAPSGSDDSIAFNAIPHRRKPKLRSLADIINEGKNLSSEHRRTKSPQVEADLVPHPQFEISSDVARLTKTQRKRKNIVLEDDIGPLETNPPTITAKRTKGTAIEAQNNNNNNNNNTCKRAEISESDTERDRPMRLDLRFSAKNQANKPRKQKGLDINRKMMVNYVHSTNLQKHPVAAGDSFGNTGHVGPFFKNPLYGQESDIISDVSKGKRHEEDDYSPYMPNSIREKVALDLSLSSYMVAGINIGSQESSQKNTGIPDLNESIVEKTYMAEEQVPTFSETRDFALRGNLHMSTSSSVLTKQPQAFQNMNNNNNINNNNDNNNNYHTAVESGLPSDDIPMEIVELLAKNQHERALDNSRNLFKRSPHYVESTPGTINIPYTNARSSLNVPSGNMGVGKGYFNLPQSRNCCSDIAILDKSQFSQFSPLTPSQQSVPLYSGPNSISGSRPSEGADLLWPPRRKGVTFDLTGTPNRSVKTNGFGDRSFMGRDVGYNINGDGRRCVNDKSLVKDGRFRPGGKYVGSVDAYTNDTIPAMQLLSLMDQRIVSGSSFKVGPNNFLDPQFSPCNHHSRLNENDNPLVSSSSFFAKSSHNKDFPALLNGARYSGDNSKISFPQGQMPQHKENSKDIGSAGPSNLVIQPSRIDLKLEVCMLNRNPADFSIPDAKNEFTISDKDLKPKKRNSSKGKSRTANVESPKKQKVRKDSAWKESSRV
ncbi:hypothetical protein OROGR_012831 [Orobanche gracilis]